MPLCVSQLCVPRSAIALPGKTLLVRMLERAFGAMRASARQEQPRHRCTGRAPAATVLPSAPLRALTLAAMALPGMAYATEIEDAQIQYSRYQEGGRTYYGGPNGTVKQPDPLQVDSLQLGLGLRLTDRTRLLFNYLQDTWSGATPVLSAPEGFLTVSGASAYPARNSLVNQQLVPYGVGPGGTRVPQPTVYNVMTSASPETRRQIGLTLNHEWDTAAVSLGGGFSQEPDFTSYFVQLGGRWDLNRKLTTLTAGVSYTSSSIDANLGPPVEWIDYGKYRNASSGPSINTVIQNGQVTQQFVGDREDWSANVGLTQVLSRNTTGSLGLTYAHSSGFLENPYKLVMLAFANPNTPPFLFGGLLQTRLFSVAESRPDTRDQWTVNANLTHYVAPANAAVHLNLGYAQDDWGIRSQTLEVDWSQGFGRGWVVTPRARYYSQNAADFYQPYFIWAQQAPINATGTLDFSKVPAQYYSSDYRLSGFGALSAGVNLSKQFGNGLSLLAGLEYYVHSGGLKLGGGGEADFGNFDAWMVTLGLGLDLTATPVPTGHVHAGDGTTASGHASHAGMLAPAGVMNAHMLDTSKPFMVAYHGMWSRQSGSVLNGSTAASDQQIAGQGCGAIQCTMTPTQMTMYMHMLDLMYAPSDQVNFVAMVPWMDMDMSMRSLEGTISGGGGEHDHAGHTSHSSGGLGDIWLGALFRLFGTPNHEVHAGLGLSIPTGSVQQKSSSGDLMDYGMQLGSGTWDLQPSLTYNGMRQRWFWGAQISGIWRTIDQNDSGYALGNLFQGTAWGGFRFTDWLSASLRGVYTNQAAITGQFNGPQMQMGPQDFPQNYGGKFWDVGLGLSAALPGRVPQGDRISFEWLQPVSQDVNGYQLERTGTAWLSLSFSF